MTTRFVRLACAIALIGVAIVTCLVAYMRTKQSVEPAFVPATIVVPERFQRKIVLLGKDGSRTEHDGRELYRKWFLSGWDDCVDYFVADWKFGSVSYWRYEPDGDSDFGAPWIISAPDEIVDARRDGWRMCRERIKAEMKTRSESDVRAMLR